MRWSPLCRPAVRGLAPAGAWLVLIAAALGQYQDTSADSARAYSNNRTDANISDQGSGYGPAPYGPYGPYYSRPAASAAQNRAGAQQTGGLPNPGVPIPSDQSWFQWYRMNRRPLVDAGVAWAETADKLTAEKVTAGGEMDRAGLHAGDELISIDGHAVHSAGQWQQLVSSLKPAQPVVVVVRREGELTALAWTVSPAEPPGAAWEGPGPADRSGVVEFVTAARLRAGPHGEARLGVVLEKEDDRAVVHAVDAGGAAALAGLLPGDVVESLSGRTVGSPQELIRLVAQARPGSTVALYVKRAAPESVPPSPAE